MSPGLLDPEKFGLKDGRQTKHSDRYALGMVVYEVLSGQVPFFRYPDYAVVVRVLKGERPGRPRGEEGMGFTDEIRNTLELCWKANPSDRPSIEEVLRCLEMVSRSWTPPSAHTAACPPAISSVAWNSEPSTEESTGDGESPLLSSKESGGIPDRVSCVGAWQVLGLT